MRKKEEILRIMERIESGKATEEDIRIYNSWCQSFQEKNEEIPFPEMSEEMWRYIKNKTEENPRRSSGRRVLKIAVAASIFLVVGFFGFRIFNGKVADQNFTEALASNDIDPGGNKATLTLANGQRILLDSARIGQLASQGSSRILKSDSGMLTYDVGTVLPRQEEIQYNTLSVPKGGQYKLVLPDGTKAWVNAASTIRYPTAFVGKERRIEVTGEVYLEVTKDADRPFLVSTRNSEIKVLGTHFNVMAYEDEPAVKTTLLEGSVSVSVPGSDHAAVIKPGQQAAVNNEDLKLEIEEVNAIDVAAWTQGLLSLRDCSVQEFMNQLSRWYDVEVKYTDQVPEKRFGGLINRNAKLSDVLAALEAAGIHTKIASGEIIVLSDK